MSTVDHGVACVAYVGGPLFFTAAARLTDCPYQPM